MSEHDFHNKENISFCMGHEQMGDTVWWLHALSRLRETFPKEKYNIIVPINRVQRPGADGKMHHVFAFNRLLYRSPELAIYWLHPDGQIEHPNQKLYYKENEKPVFDVCQFRDIDRFIFSVFEKTSSISAMPFNTDALEKSDHSFFYQLPPIMFYPDPCEFDTNSDTAIEQNEIFNAHETSSPHVIDHFCGQLEKFLKDKMNVILSAPNSAYIVKVDENTELPYEILYNSDGTRRPLVVIQTGTAGTIYKNIKPEVWGKVGELLHAAGCTVIFIGRGSDPDPTLGKEHVIGIVSHVREQNIPGTLRFVANSDLVISGDTGVAHLAALYGRKTLTIFGTASSLQQAHPYPNPGRAEDVYALQNPSKYDMFNPQPPRSTAEEIYSAAIAILAKSNLAVKPHAALNKNFQLLQPALKTPKASMHVLTHEY
jgi:ADP-heptose:LPS heptosyltransferase